MATIYWADGTVRTVPPGSTITYKGRPTTVEEINAREAEKRRARGLGPHPKIPGSPTNTNRNIMTDRQYLESVKAGREPSFQEFDVNQIQAGLSPAMQGLSEQQKNLFAMESKAARDNMQADALRGLSTGQNAMAMRGGLGSGARERMFSGSMRDAGTNMARFDTQSAIEKARGDMDLGLKDWGAKYDTGRANTQGRNAFNLAQYTADNQLLGARYGADATRQASKDLQNNSTLWSWLGF